MAKTPRISGKDAKRAFERAGFVLDRIDGSHHIMKKDGHRYLLTVPIHGNKTLGVGLIKSLIEAAGLTVDQFKALLESKKPATQLPSPPRDPPPATHDPSA